MTRKSLQEHLEEWLGNDKLAIDRAKNAVNSWLTGYIIEIDNMNTIYEKLHRRRAILKVLIEETFIC